MNYILSKRIPSSVLFTQYFPQPQQIDAVLDFWAYRPSVPKRSSAFLSRFPFTVFVPSDGSVHFFYPKP